MVGAERRDAGIARCAQRPHLEVVGRTQSRDFGVVGRAQRGNLGVVPRAQGRDLGVVRRAQGRDLGGVVGAHDRKFVDMRGAQRFLLGFVGAAKGGDLRAAGVQGRRGLGLPFAQLRFELPTAGAEALRSVGLPLDQQRPEARVLRCQRLELVRQRANLGAGPRQLGLARLQRGCHRGGMSIEGGKTRCHLRGVTGTPVRAGGHPRERFDQLTQRFGLQPVSALQPRCTLQHRVQRRRRK